MLAAIALTPSAPVLVPELAGAAQEAVEVRAAVTAAAAVLGNRWVAIGLGAADQVCACARGTFAGYGADVRVALDPDAPRAVTAMPLCALIAGWLRGTARPDAAVTVHVQSRHAQCPAAMACGRRLRAAIDASPDPIGVLVVADGANTLTGSAPGGFDPDSLRVQADLDDALAAADTAALARLPDSILGRVAYQVLAGLTEGGAWSAQELYRGAPYGVGYFAGVWRPAAHAPPPSAP